MLEDINPYMLWRYADDYLDAARVVGAADRHFFSGARYFLLGRSAELCLKALLLANGVSLADLKHKLSHDIASALTCAKEKGLIALTPGEERELLLLNETYKQKLEEYPRTGPIPVREPRVIETFVAQTLASSKEACRKASLKSPSDLKT